MACRALPAGTAPAIRNASPVPQPRRRKLNLPVEHLTAATSSIVSMSTSSASSWGRAFERLLTPVSCHSGPASPTATTRTRRAPVPRPRRRKMNLPTELLSPRRRDATATTQVSPPSASSSASSVERDFEQLLTTPTATSKSTSNPPEALLGANEDKQRPLHNVAVMHKSWPTEYVCGVALLNGELFVLCHGRIDRQVDVHSTAVDDFALLRRLSIPGLGRYDADDMVSCLLKNCLYISDTGNACIHRVCINGSVSKWKVPGEPCGLSVTPGGQLLVVCRGEPGRIVELTADGSILRMRQIKLPADTSGACQAAQLTAGQFVVCQRGQSGLSVVDADGRVTQSYRSTTSGSELNATAVTRTRADRWDDETELGCPCHVTVDGQSMLVVDHDNHRVVSLSRSLQFIREVIAVALPNRLCLDRVTRRLYVGHACGVTVVHL